MWPNLQETADLVTFTEEALMGNFIFCAVMFLSFTPKNMYNTKYIFDIFRSKKQWQISGGDSGY